MRSAKRLSAFCLNTLSSNYSIFLVLKYKPKRKYSAHKPKCAVYKTVFIFYAYHCKIVLLLTKFYFMQKLIQKFATTFAVFGCFLACQAQTTCQLDSSYYYNELNILTSKGYYVYNAINKPSEKTGKIFENGSWNNSSKQILSYTTSGKVTNDTRQFWQNNQWKNSNRSVYDFDANDNQLTFLQQAWDSATAAWKLSGFQQYYTYNINNKKTKQIQVSISNGIVNDSTRQTFSYDAGGNELSLLREGWTSSNPTWRNIQKLVYFYNANNQKDSSYNLIWNPGTTAFDTVYKDAFVYDAAGNQIENGSYQNSGNLWIPKTKGVYTYDANNNNTFQGGYTWIGLTSTWRADNEQTVAYNSNNQVTNGINKSYDFASSTLLYNYRYTYSYDANDNLTLKMFDNYTANNWQYNNRTEFFNSCGNSVGINETDAVEFQLYPNPTNNIINITTAATIETLTVYNLQGQSLIEVKSNIKQLELSNLAQGAYIIQMKTAEGFARRTIVKQ